MNTRTMLFRTLFVSALLYSAGSICRGQNGPNRTGEEYDEYAAPPVSDPFEHFNRAMFRFNDGFYRHALRPVSRVYQRTVPKIARRGLVNVFDNLKFPLRFVNCALQAKPVRAGRELEKFLLNSTVGLAGLIRVSDSHPALATLPAEDVGQTLGVWGLRPGPYLVLPLLGPSSMRDATGTVGDAFLNPVNWAGTSHSVKGFGARWRYSINAIDFISLSPELMRTYDDFIQSALDPYISVRDGYLQFRAAAVKQ